jgi:hypothetical protein
MCYTCGVVDCPPPHWPYNNGIDPPANSAFHAVDFSPTKGWGGVRRLQEDSRLLQSRPWSVPAAHVPRSQAAWSSPAVTCPMTASSKCLLTCSLARAPKLAMSCVSSNAWAQRVKKIRLVSGF